ncbi:Intraflagellar transport protein 46 [Phytophthora cinnamomi]|uniref:Intraflagellar transport protein 46 n=1 Tax=Phytophthora cinnamomi TaxID=4785 RepID=UPI003559E4C5|nr:Intraflagellar transport protein 46 [Phytophthora cinnamomi]
MSDSDEEKVLLDDESMDEVHELEDALQVSVDTAASSPVKRRLHGGSSSSEGSEGGRLNSEDSSSEEESFLDRPGTRNGGASMGGLGSVSRARAEESSDEDSDEPPEIPGSPIAQKLQAGVVSVADFGAVPISTKLSPDRLDMKGSAIFGEEDEYEVKEVEQSRAAEFHASSSSEDEGESDDCNRRDFHERTKFQLQMERSALGRPKTAAKDLEKYRDVVPSDFFQQFEGATTPDGAESPPSNFAKATSSRTDNSVQNSARVLSARRDGSNQLKYKAAVPRDVEELFSLTDAYTPEDVEIETRLEPFLPEFTPAVGLPFDGILIPRPDGKEDKLGVEVLREPSGQTNVAELELLMQISMTNQHKLRSRGDVVRSIEWAARRPQELDQWIASVEKVQRTKPLAQVNYKQAMPPLAQLMELWPEEFEDFLAAQKATVPTLSELDVNLKELAKVVCALLDIPVYEGNCVQSLHVLFSLYLEIQAYERDQQGLQR